jgi:glyoxylase-like metal-dependent hydrolase (beta-lactamase superfamily II)
MNSQIQTIPLPMPFHMGLVNSYLIQKDGAFFLIDTGSSYSRKVLVAVLENAGCQPGMLNLIILTHGDYDHTGNAAYLRKLFGAKIAMHAADAGMLTRGDMFEGRKRPNALIRKLIPMLSGFGKAERCAPDILLLDGEHLSAYGLDARVVGIPGHSQGSIGILTVDGELFCGDLLENLKKPALGSIMDDVPTARTSLQKLRDLNVQVIFPGHGRPFQMHELTGE